MSWRSLLRVCLSLLIATVVAGCGGGAATPESVPDTPAPVEEPTQAPTEVPTAAPTAAPTEAPTAAPTEVPTETPEPAPEESARFTWAAGGNLPADSDDVDDIVGELRRSHEGITGGFGNEIGVTILYNPEIMSLEEVMEALAEIGHPVEASN